MPNTKIVQLLVLGYGVQVLKALVFRAAGSNVGKRDANNTFIYCSIDPMLGCRPQASKVGFEPILVDRKSTCRSS